MTGLIKERAIVYRMVGQFAVRWRSCPTSIRIIRPLQDKMGHSLEAITKGICQVHFIILKTAKKSVTSDKFLLRCVPHWETLIYHLTVVRIRAGTFFLRAVTSLPRFRKSGYENEFRWKAIVISRNSTSSSSIQFTLWRQCRILC